MQPNFPVIRVQDIIAGYLTDASNTRGRAEALVRPSSTEQVAEMVRFCQETATPLTVTAQRTSTTGAPVPNGGWLLSTEALATIHSIDSCDAGVLLGEYQRHVQGQGSMFPPDPTSRNECTVGAAIACNASGARTFRFGPTRSWVEAVEFVTPTGEVLKADRNTPIPAHWPAVQWKQPATKTAAGFFPADNLLDLMIGQEGTLGIITRAWTRLIGDLPHCMSMLVFFEDLVHCLDFVDIARKGAERPHSPATADSLNPMSIEFYDKACLDLVRDQVPEIPAEAMAALFIEVPYDQEAPFEPWTDALMEATALADFTVIAESPREQALMHKVRHAIPASVNEQVVRNSMPKIGTDFSVPDNQLRAMFDHYHRVTIDHVIFGHIGDNHLHLNMLPQSADELAAARQTYRQLAMQAVALGGTVSAEHGIGKLKRELLAEMVGDEVTKKFRALKSALDPNWILGRGTMLEPPEND